MSFCVFKKTPIYEEVQIKEHDAGKQWKHMTLSAWKDNINVSIGGIAMLLSTHAYKAFSLTEKYHI